jgi:predicted DNA-binding protein (MmcQ/YjbR family)
MNKKHWNTVELNAGIPDGEIRKMIDHSYDLVASRLQKAKHRDSSR